MILSERITKDPAICHGKPCIRGLRYPVASVLEMLAGGMQTSEVLADYPKLGRDNVRFYGGGIPQVFCNGANASPLRFEQLVNWDSRA